MARLALVSGGSPNLAVGRLVPPAVSGELGLLALYPVGEAHRYEPRLGRTLLRHRGATSNPAQLFRTLLKVVDVAFSVGTLTSAKTTFAGQELVPWLVARRIARQTLRALPSLGSKEAAGIVHSMMGLGRSQEKARQGKIPTFAHQG